MFQGEGILLSHPYVTCFRAKESVSHWCGMFQGEGISLSHPNVACFRAKESHIGVVCFRVKGFHCLILA